MRDASGQCCARNEVVRGGVCTLIVRPPPRDALGEFCSESGNGDNDTCNNNRGGGNGDAGGGGGAGGGAGGDDGDDTAPEPDYEDDLIEDFLEDFEAWDGLNAAERELVIENPVAAWFVGGARDIAEAETARLFPSHVGHNDEADAFRHALWSGLMAWSIGGALAEAFGTAHESDATAMNEVIMDLHNNDVGRQIGMVLRVSAGGNVMAGVYPMEAFINEVQFALTSGRLITSP